MKSILTCLILFISLNSLTGQNTTDKQMVESTCMNYIEGFYQGEESKLIECLQPTLNKFGFWKNKDSGEYEQEKSMTYGEALAYARRVQEKKHFAKEGAPKKVEILDIGNSIASAKITAWWGIDYILLSKRDTKWMIEQVLWEGPLEKK